MPRYLPYIYGGLVAILAIRGAARGGLGSTVQGYFNAIFVSLDDAPEA